MNNPKPLIRFASHDARRGAYWLHAAHAMLSTYRVAWLSLLFLYYLVVGIVDLVPIVGQFGLPLLKPVFAVGFLAAAWNQERGGKPELRLLFQGFRSNLWALLPLGAFMLIGISVAVLSTSLVDGGKLVAVLSGKLKLDETLLATGELQAGMLFAALLAMPVILALWFAPALVVFQDCNAVEALALSLRASLANWKPLTVYSLLVFVFGGVLPGVATALVSAVIPASYVLPVVVALLLPYVFLFVATLHISDYVSYRDVFHFDERLDNPPAAG
jgi:hypothetical protein